MRFTPPAFRLGVSVRLGRWLTLVFFACLGGTLEELASSKVRAYVPRVDVGDGIGESDTDERGDEDLASVSMKVSLKDDRVSSNDDDGNTGESSGGRKTLGSTVTNGADKVEAQSSGGAGGNGPTWSVQLSLNDTPNAFGSTW